MEPLNRLLTLVRVPARMPRWFLICVIVVPVALALGGVVWLASPREETVIAPAVPPQVGTGETGHCVDLEGSIVRCAPPGAGAPSRSLYELRRPAVGGLDRVPMVMLFAIAVSTFCLLISTVILIISLPIYLFSADGVRAARAGGLVKTTLGFIVGSGAAVLGTLGFT